MAPTRTSPASSGRTPTLLPYGHAPTRSIFLLLPSVAFFFLLLLLLLLLLFGPPSFSPQSSYPFCARAILFLTREIAAVSTSPSHSHSHARKLFISQPVGEECLLFSFFPLFLSLFFAFSFFDLFLGCFFCDSVPLTGTWHCGAHFANNCRVQDPANTGIACQCRHIAPKRCYIYTASLSGKISNLLLSEASCWGKLGSDAGWRF